MILTRAALLSYYGNGQWWSFIPW